LPEASELFQDSFKVARCLYKSFWVPKALWTI